MNTNLKPSKINEALLLNDDYFSQQEENIDYLVQKALGVESDSIKIEILCSAAEKCEKFHSYFHFEESFFHTVDGDFYQQDDPEHAAICYRNAIKLYPLNKYAHFNP